MKQTPSYIVMVGEIIEALEQLCLSPVLVGGMALVILGSQRVTKDFDFLISKECLDFEKLLRAFYKKGFELASKVDERGNIVRTFDNLNIAKIRLQSDQPDSVYFLNRKTGLRIDLLFDFPLLARDLAARASRKKIRSYYFLIASKEDLLRLKHIAHQARASATDAQDLEFLSKL